MCISRAKAIRDKLYPMRCKQCTFTLSSVIQFVALLQQTTRHQFVAFLSARGSCMRCNYIRHKATKIGQASRPQPEAWRVGVVDQLPAGEGGRWDMSQKS